MLEPKKYTCIVLLFTILLFPFPQTAIGEGHEASTDISAHQALEAGNKRFVEGKLSHPKQDAARRKVLAQGQKPSAIILSCSDSRVPPELIFDQGLGEIFTIRVAGNVLGAATVASIEYAVEHLGSQLLVVLGHESCGAVQAALSTPPEKSAGSPDLDNIVSSIRSNLDGIDRSVASPDKHFRKAVMQNVDGIGNRLMKRSKIVRGHIQSGKLKIVHGVYSLETGKVDFWNTSNRTTN